MSSLFSLSDAASPYVAIEIAAGRVSAAALDWRGGRPVVATHGIEPLPDGALVPSLTAANTHDRAAVITAVNRVLERVGRPRRVSLVVPDAVAKVSLVRFEQVPARTSDLAQLVRWQVRKAAPFPAEEAQVAYVRGLRQPDGHEFIVTLARRAVIEEYEGLCAEAGAHAGVVDLATFNVINAVLAGAPPPAGDPSTGPGSPRAESRGDWLLVNVASDSASTAILRGDNLIFFRNHRVADGDGTLADLVHETGMYYEDRLQGGGFARAVLCGRSEALEEIRRTLHDRIPAPIEIVDPRQAAGLTDRITASPSLLETLTPLVGVLLRDRERVTA